MPNYHRIRLKGGTYFFTVVTYKRYPIFKEILSIDLLRQCFQDVIVAHPFRIDAIVILPDHIHSIWTLPYSESDFSNRWRLIKRKFSIQYDAKKAIEICKSISDKKEKGIWQRRFWEHAIRDEEDFNRDCDYINYNPVKHGLVGLPGEWKYSSFRSFVEKGAYPANW